MATKKRVRTSYLNVSPLFRSAARGERGFGAFLFLNPHGGGTGQYPLDVQLSGQQFDYLQPDEKSYFRKYTSQATGRSHVMHHRDPSCYRGREGLHPEHREMVTKIDPVSWEESWPCPSCYSTPTSPPLQESDVHGKPGPTHLLRSHFSRLNADHQWPGGFQHSFTRAAHERYKQGRKISPDLVKGALRELGLSHE